MTDRRVAVGGRRGRAVDASGAGTCAPRTRADDAQSGGRRVHRVRRGRGRRRRVRTSAPASRTPKCTRWKKPVSRARRDALLHARAVRPSGPDRPLHRSHHRGRYPPRRGGDGGSDFRRCRAAGFAACGRTASRWMSGSAPTRRPALNQPFLTTSAMDVRLSLLKAATSLDGRIAAAPGRRTPLDVDSRLAPRTVSTGVGRCDRGRLRDGARGRSAADGARRVSRAPPGARRVRPPAADAADARLLSTLRTDPS